MKRRIMQVGVLAAAVVFLSFSVFELNAEARAGGSRSMGSRGSRSYSPSSPRYSPSGQTRQQAAPAPSPQPQMQQPAPGGFMRNMAGGLLGGFLGGMLFRGLAGAGWGGGMGGGIGLFEILLLAGIGYLVYRFVKGRRQSGMDSSPSWGPSAGIPPAQEPVSAPDDVNTGLSYIRQMDHSFDEQRFKDQAMDIFFRVQGAWMGRDLSSSAALLTDEIRRDLQDDLERMVRERRTNRLENIAVRSVEIVEAWQESGQDYITALLYANLLDYTVDDATGALVSGSKSDPVKFEEYWTFTRPVGNNPWRLSAIQQK